MKTMIRSGAVLLLSLLVLSVALQAQQAKEVRGVGCVESGLDSQCLLLRDMGTGLLYSLRQSMPRPAAGEAIEFTAVPQQGVNLCMQGEAVVVTQWVRRQSLSCPSSGVGGQQAAAKAAPGIPPTLPGYSIR